MPSWIWISFVGFILALLLLDLGAFNRKPRVISIREALAWTVAWIVLALLFDAGVYVLYEYRLFGVGQAVGHASAGSRAAMEFLAGFVLEKSLSLDNLFVMALIFAYFRVPAAYQHRVLFWGILGVLVLRGAMIGAGTVFFHWFTWANYVFGGLLIITAIRMLRTSEDTLEPDRNALVRAARRLYPVSSQYDGARFFTEVDGQPACTPLFLVLLAIESSDVVFATDSIPAVFGVTQDPFLIFTSNIFAVLGLRSLYFVLAGILRKFKHLKTSLFLVLMYVGAKMLLTNYYQIDIVVSLMVISGILVVGLLASGPGASVEAQEKAAAEPGSGPVAGAQGVSPAPLRSAAVANDLAIRADQVTKFYGRQRGIIDFSAAIPRGALVGLIGPNGAGKTTAIRILTCHMPPTSGTVRVCGFDAFSQSLEIRRRLGYLPENCPLYPEMRVIEYLRWTAQMKGLRGSDAERAIFQTLDPCGIDAVRAQPIGTLSKGYRQRLGLAAALVHRPEVLILDEPTIGLDPLQAREFRSLIGSLRGKHTVLISSHILSEIEVLCDSLIILNEGRVVACGSPQDLRGAVAPCYSVECRIDPALKVLIPQLIHGLLGITLEKYEEDGEFAHFRLASEGPDPRLELFRVFARAGIEIRELVRERVTLEDVFVRYTRAGSAVAPPPEVVGGRVP